MLLRAEKIEFADPISTYAGIATASWSQQPFTLKGDTLKFEESDPDETEEECNETEAPTDYIAIGNAKELTGSFVNFSKAQMVGLLGGSVEGDSPNEKAVISATKTILEKAIRITDKSGGTIIIPRAKGYCKFSADYSSSLKAPFKFKAMQADPAWDVDVIWD